MSRTKFATAMKIVDHLYELLPAKCTHETAEEWSVHIRSTLESLGWDPDEFMTQYVCSDEHLNIPLEMNLSRERS